MFENERRWGVTGVSVVVDRSLLEVAGAANRAGNAADAARLAAMDAYYESRMSWPEAGADARVRPSERSVTSELASKFAVSDGMVGGWLTLWARMNPAVRDAFAAGDISQKKCHVIKARTDGAPAAAVRSVIDEVVRCAVFMAPGPLGTEIDRLLTEADPEWDSASRKHSRTTEPKVSLHKLPREMVKVAAVVTAEESVEIDERIVAQRASVCAFDGRSPDVLRRDALMALVRGTRLTCRCERAECPHAAAADGSADSEAAAPVVLHLHADLELILGISSADAQLQGYGPVSAEVCRTLAADASWRAIFVAGWRYLDMLGGGDDADEVDADNDGSAEGGDPECRCSCGECCCGRAGMTTDRRVIDDVLRTGHRREDRRVHEETAGQGRERGRRRRRSPAQGDPVVVLGRSRGVAAGWVAASEVPTAQRARAASERVDYWRSLVEAEPDVDFGLYPDGHGGMDTPPPGALTYAPGAALAQYVRGIYPTCVQPGCGVSSDRCDLDHGVDFDKKNPLLGGWTIASNLTPKCRAHHNLKTGKTWRYRMLPDGVLQVTDPLGNHYFRAL